MGLKTAQAVILCCSSMYLIHCILLYDAESLDIVHDNIYWYMRFFLAGFGEMVFISLSGSP